MTALDPAAARVLLLVALVLVLQAPSCLVSQLAQEREQLRTAAGEEIAASWGRALDLQGPLLRVPYRVRTRKDNVWTTGAAVFWATYLPERLEVVAQARTELRRRGLFGFPVFRARLTLRGHFAPPVRAGPAAGRGVDGARLGRGGTGAAILGSASPAFEAQVTLRGSGALLFTPLSRDTTVRLDADWPHPSFRGAWLPADRTVRPDGFSAHWAVTDLARGLPLAWLQQGIGADAIAQARFGVDLLQPVDPYRMSQRSVRYAALFVGLTFLVLWLFEVRSARRVRWTALPEDATGQ